MILTLDVGNTQTTGAIYRADQPEIIRFFRRSSSKNHSVDELGLFLRSILAEAGVAPEDLKACCLCSVVREITRKLGEAVQRYLGLRPKVLKAVDAEHHGIHLLYHEPSQLGTDRLAAAMGAKRLCPDRNCLVVDFGTAITVDALSRQGDLLGGAILLGPNLSMSALEGRTSRLPFVEVKAPEDPCGRSTVECIQSGLFYGTLGSVKEVLERLRTSCGFTDEVILATGGLAPLFRDENLFHQEIPDLVLQGLWAMEGG